MNPIPPPSFVAFLAISLLGGTVLAGALTPDYAKPNYANSPPLRKFVDALPGVGPAAANNLGQYIPVAVADTTTFERSNDAGLTWKRIANRTAAPALVTYKNSGLKRGTTYAYRVQAYNTNGPSTFSNVSSARTLP